MLIERRMSGWLLLSMALLLGGLLLAGSTKATARDAQAEVVAELRGPTAHAERLARLRRWGQTVWRTDGDRTAAYAVRLNRLARVGRKAAVHGQRAISANEYVPHLAQLQRQGRNALNDSHEIQDAYAHTEWLGELRRLEP